MKVHNENALFISVSVCMTMAQCNNAVYSEKKEENKAHSQFALYWIEFAFLSNRLRVKYDLKFVSISLCVFVSLNIVLNTEVYFQMQWKIDKLLEKFILCAKEKWAILLWYAECSFTADELVVACSGMFACFAFRSVSIV